MISINAAFDGGNIICDDSSNPADIRLRIRRDSQADFFQWFYFRLAGARGTNCVMHLANAGEASYPLGWEGYRTVASYDLEHWFRIDTNYQGGTLTFRHRPERDVVYYAYFAPYDMARHVRLIARALQSPHVRHEVLGRSVEGQDMDLLTIGGGGKSAKNIWMIARQHPGETMAEWWIEGMLERLLDPDDAVAGTLLERACFYVVPNMNPDGSRLGNLRTNAAGANLNREWQDPDPGRSPEVYHVRQKMRERGVDLCLDVHGDEGLPYNFIAGAEGTPGWTAARARLLNDFRHRWAEINPDFQTEHGYPKVQKGRANMTICTNHISDYFGCLAMTLEMPFKDAANRPSAATGWSPSRAKRLGSSVLDMLNGMLDRL